MEIREDIITSGTSFEDLHSAQEEFILNSNEYVCNLVRVSEEMSVLLELSGDNFVLKNKKFYLDVIMKIEDLILTVEENSSFIERNVPNEDISDIYSKRAGIMMLLSSYKKILSEEINK